MYKQIASGSIGSVGGIVMRMIDGNDGDNYDYAKRAYSMGRVAVVFCVSWKCFI
jgi:hypothetical protein